ncbi:MAG: hypothetical protein KME47_10040 [Nodosilinea sp. WJT8-NPBG4]|jgi:hypothetical protein|nr:hypothetical protein [Nodosilinea sp. WJT8-NPBG4]
MTIQTSGGAGKLASTLGLNDEYALGDEPFFVGHMTQHPGLVGVIGCVVAPIICLSVAPAFALSIALAGINDFKYASRKQSKSAKRSAITVEAEEVIDTPETVEVAPPVRVKQESNPEESTGLTDYEQVNLTENVEAFYNEPLAPDEWVEQNTTVPSVVDQIIQARQAEMPVQPQSTATVIKDYTQEVRSAHKAKKPIPVQMAETLESLLIIGNPGAGKGMLVSNAIAHVKALNPGIKVVGIDPKNDPKETGYWTTHFDRVHRISHESLEDADYIKWFKERIQEFKDTPEDILYVIDEWTITCRKFLSTDKAEFASFISFMIGVSSSGDSRRKYVWGVGQIPHNGSMGMTGGDRAIFKPIAIVSKKRKDLASQFINTSFVPSPEEGMKTLEDLMDKSEVDRAIFYNEWQPLDRLHNYSGYDRDTRSWVSEPQNVTTPSIATAQLSLLDAETPKAATQLMDAPSLDTLLGDMVDLDSLMGEPVDDPVICTDYIDGVIKQALSSPKKEHQCLGGFLEHLKKVGHGNTFKASDVTGSSAWATKWLRDGLLPDRKVDSIAKYITAAMSIELLTENNEGYTVTLR